MFQLRLCAAAAFGLAMLPAHADPLLNPLFQDHAVLQQGQPIRVWGSAPPGETVTASIAGASATAQADSSGRWKADLPAMTAGGPYALAVTTNAGAAQTVSDVLIGDVYLCSGQSNMALPVMMTGEMGSAANDRIRLMTVATVANTTPLAALSKPVTWSPAVPKAVTAFSAVCYFYALELQKSVNVPLGLIAAPWGGANITAYMSADALHRAGGNDDRIEALKLYTGDPAAGMKRWGEIAESWWRGKYQTPPWSDPAASANWPQAPDGLGVWNDWNIPAFQHFVGHVWFRTTVTLTAAEAAQASQLSLGSMSEEDQTWVNGKFLAATFGFGEKRSYGVPAGLLHEGDNDILVQLYCSWVGCGMAGPAEARAVVLKDGTSVRLPSRWRYQIVPAAAGIAPRVPWGSTQGITMAYNGMIAPLAPYGLKGVLWYQGESNTVAATAYRGLTKAWMADWRDLFAAPKLPFLIVQLPNYGPAPFKPEDTGWARLREAQRLAVNDDPHAGLAVTIDIGDQANIHPSNKHEVGRRLALAGRRVIYGDASAKSGPAPLRASQDGGRVIVSFTGVNGKLEVASGAQPTAFELCGATQASCTFVAAKVNGNTVSLAVPKGLTATRVRYCWGDGPICTLYDSERLPAVPFELPLAAKAKP